MLRILVDTCVWLDLAKDYRNQPVVAALEDLLNHPDFGLIVPQTVLDEFARNKERVAADAKRSLQSHFSLVRDAVRRFGNEKDIDPTIKALNEVDHAAVYKGEAVNESFERIERMLQAAEPIAATESVKARAADRALRGSAPCHRPKNSIGDSIIIETYAEQMAPVASWDDEFAFVTHNKADFSEEAGDHRQPHADLLPLFDGGRSTFWISLADMLNDLDQDLLANYDLQLYGATQVRGFSEIREAEHLLYKQVWYNRHQNLRISIERGKTKIVSGAEWSAAEPRRRQTLITQGTWKLAREAANRTEQEVGIQNLGPWDDFEWGMINGKLSALRWVLGDDWDMLDT
ncbi:PIN domain-containing protein [Mesorhizobium sp. CA12]|uniref:PIN domain-containing protein n=1 Tax=Mesorhizobium sp. CA12 TaxID=2876644 RepID=UPI001CCCE3FE|nr:PIN domain-containing protein [Mesorhizobium sp. CA12]MBZ9860422.1 PIN domain-containing protein [Mesorhizobium sp. CA12]